MNTEELIVESHTDDLNGPELSVTSAIISGGIQSPVPISVAASATGPARNAVGSETLDQHCRILEGTSTKALLLLLLA